MSTDERWLQVNVLVSLRSVLIFDFPLVEDLRCFRGGAVSVVRIGGPSGQGGKGLMAGAGAGGKGIDN
jgi:hypothetical protein